MQQKHLAQRNSLLYILHLHSKHHRSLQTDLSICLGFCIGLSHQLDDAAQALDRLHFDWSSGDGHADPGWTSLQIRIHYFTSFSLEGIHTGAI